MGIRDSTYGTNEGTDLRALEVHSLLGLGVQAELVWWNAPQGQLEIAAPGVHNVRNALAALVVGVSCGVALDACLLYTSMCVGRWSRPVRCVNFRCSFICRTCRQAMPFGC